MKAKRYDLKWSVSRSEHMAETGDGAFVDWGDYEKLLSLLAQVARGMLVPEVPTATDLLRNRNLCEKARLKIQEETDVADDLWP